MEIISNQIVIGPEDEPMTVNYALHEGVGWGNENLSGDRAYLWYKYAADAWGTLRDGFGIVQMGSPEEDLIFNPNGEARIFMGADQLELSLVAYGVKRLNENDPRTDQDVARVDHALTALDQARGVTR